MILFKTSHRLKIPHEQSQYLSLDKALLEYYSEFSPRHCYLLRTIEDTLIICPVLQETEETDD